MPDIPRLPGLSVRVKLALSYAGFLVVAGIAMIAVGLLLLRYIPEGNLDLVNGGWVPNRTDLLEVFYRYVGWATVGLVGFGLAGGWVLAGWVLRPLRRITDAAAQARDGALDRRIRMPGHRDELTELADAFDALLDRVQRTLDEERRFAANASHELRTPHAIVRTLVEVAQADPAGRDVDTVLARIGETNDRAIALTEALLALARVGRDGALQREGVDLAEIAREAVAETSADAAAAVVTVEDRLEPAAVAGDRTLLARLAANLVRNAVVHNDPGGTVLVATADLGDAVALVVVNTGRVLPPTLIATLTEPFVRAGGRTHPAAGEGSGLGLAIADAIVRAHDGSLTVTAREGGGLHVRVTLPR
ncbi:sensor histidine kinase [Microbacterium sp. RD1]|uniref:sensor histidine kinase n=1 Tax=Microbacterium sp. RD1 TaxID=3457313 RepID=UPI003FA5EB25